ncbi:MAG: alpha/beta fold hydrolase [Candidatus Hydrogenedens sp.]|nr:alpha/beta fold hydrolase [Candidatus Hydrogenedens sp.]
MPKFDIAFFLSNKIKQYDEQQERNPSTKILKGAEPLELGDKDSDIALLMVHGFSGCPTDFEKLPYNLTNLGIFIKVILLPGHGTSPLDFEKISADLLLDAVVDEIINLKKHYKTVLVIGHSMGGALATLAYVKIPFDGLILAAPYYGITFNPRLIFPPEKWIQLLSPFIRFVYTPPENQPILKKEVANQIISYHWIPTKAGLVAMKIAERAKKESILEQITCPVLLIHSKKDSVASPECAKNAFEKMASENKDILWLENSDHVIFWDYDKEIVGEKIKDFIYQFINRKGT